MRTTLANTVKSFKNKLLAELMKNNNYCSYNGMGEFKYA